MLLIRVVGGTVYFGLLELNLCPDGSQECLQKVGCAWVCPPVKDGQGSPQGQHGKAA